MYNVFFQAVVVNVEVEEETQPSSISPVNQTNKNKSESLLSCDSPSFASLNYKTNDQKLNLSNSCDQNPKGILAKLISKFCLTYNGDEYLMLKN